MRCAVSVSLTQPKRNTLLANQSADRNPRVGAIDLFASFKLQGFDALIGCRLNERSIHFASAIRFAAEVAEEKALVLGLAVEQVAFGCFATEGRNGFLATDVSIAATEQWTNEQ